MPNKPVAERLDQLERRVDVLETLPTRMTALEGQIVQLRREMHDEFSAMRGETQGVETGLRGEMQIIATGLRGEMQAIATGLRGEMQAIEIGRAHV